MVKTSFELGIQSPSYGTSIPLSDVLSSKTRFEASAFGIERRKAVQTIQAATVPVTVLYGEKGLVQEAHNAFRFKRYYVESSKGIPFLSSSDIIALHPKATNFLSRKLTSRLAELKINKWDVLISCSGTIGNIGLAGDFVAGQALSQHVIRLRTTEPYLAGFITAFLRSRFGRPQLTGASYGSVVSHIEPEHLSRVLIPNPPQPVLDKIGQKMCTATELRDRANELIEEADQLLHNLLNLPRLDITNQRQTFYRTVGASQLADRFEAGYHAPIVVEAEAALQKLACEVTTIGDPRVTREVRAVTKFRKRVYVQQGGIPMLSSKQLFQYDPIEVKRLARGAHLKDMPEIALEENMIAVTCSGTIGRVQIIPAYMAGWTANQHAIRLVSSLNLSPGYLFAWLNSDFGNTLITRHSYGSVILEVDRFMLDSIPIPIPDSILINRIGNPVMQANQLRTQAWQLEQEAITEIENLIESGSAPQ